MRRRNILDVSVDEGMLDREAAMIEFLTCSPQPELARFPMLFDFRGRLNRAGVLPLRIASIRFSTVACVLLAPAKGDVHDTGRNIVGAVLACTSYEGGGYPGSPPRANCPYTGE